MSKIIDYRIKNYPSNVQVFLYSDIEYASYWGCFDINKDMYKYIHQIEDKVIYIVEKTEYKITKKLAHKIAVAVKNYIR